MNNNTAKDDAGKLRLSLVPTQIIRDIAQVREYGCQKYHDPDNWKSVEVQRYIDAFYRHWLKFIEDPNAIDEESGLPHYKHCACNMAYLCELLQEKYDKNHERLAASLQKNTKKWRHFELTT
jgi:hypothetical protein